MFSCSKNLAPLGGKGNKISLQRNLLFLVRSLFFHDVKNIFCSNKNAISCVCVKKILTEPKPLRLPSMTVAACGFQCFIVIFILPDSNFCTRRFLKSFALEITTAKISPAFGGILFARKNVFHNNVLHF